MHLQLFNFPTPPQNSSCFIFISCPLICCAWCHQSGGISTTFVAITPIIQFPSTIGNYRKKKIKSFAIEKNVKKISSNISIFSSHSVKITLVWTLQSLQYNFYFFLSYFIFPLMSNDKGIHYGNIIARGFSKNLQGPFIKHKALISEEWTILTFSFWHLHFQNI